MDEEVLIEEPLRSLFEKQPPSRLMNDFTCPFPLAHSMSELNPIFRNHGDLVTSYGKVVLGTSRKKAFLPLPSPPAPIL